MRLSRAIVIAAAVFTMGAASPGQRQNAMHDAVARRIAAGEISGAVVLVMKNGKVVALDAQGTSSLAAGGVPLATDTVFWAASMTKPVVAAATMILVDEGKVQLDAPVSRYLPEFARTPMVRTPKPQFAYSALGRPDPKGPKTEYDLRPARRPITVRDLLSMSAGLQTLGIPNEDIPKITAEDTLATWVPKLAAAPLDFDPGSRWAYSHATGYEVLARIIEVVSERPFDEFVQRRLFDPLGMVDSSFGPRADLASRLQPLGPAQNNPIMMGRFKSGSAGLVTTVGDYSKFAQMLLQQGRVGGKQILSRRAVAAMSSNQIGASAMAGINPGDYLGLQTKASGLKYGFGFVVVTDTSVPGLAVPARSFGWDGGSTRRTWVVPAARTVLVINVPEAGPMSAAPAHREFEAIAVNPKLGASD